MYPEYLYSTGNFMCYKFVSSIIKIDINKDDNIHRSWATPTVSDHFHSCNPQKRLSYPILGSKSVKNIQIDPQTTDLGLKKVKLDVSESVISI